VARQAPQGKKKGNNGRIIKTWDQKQTFTGVTMLNANGGEERTTKLKAKHGEYSGDSPNAYGQVFLKIEKRTGNGKATRVQEGHPARTGGERRNRGV